MVLKLNLPDRLRGGFPRNRVSGLVFRSREGPHRPASQLWRSPPSRAELTLHLEDAYELLNAYE